VKGLRWVGGVGGVGWGGVGWGVGEGGGWREGRTASVGEGRERSPTKWRQGAPSTPALLDGPPPLRRRCATDSTFSLT
jgi:hypothetical protein